MTQRVNAALVDDRIGIDIGQRSHLGGYVGAGQRIGPQHAAVLIPIGVEFARAIARNDRTLPCGGRGNTKDARSCRGGGFVPLDGAIRCVDGVELVVLRHHVDGAELHRRRPTQRASRRNIPNLVPGGSIQGHNLTRAVGRIYPAVGIAGPSAECGRFEVLRYTGVMRPDLGTRIGVESGDDPVASYGIQAATAHDWSGGKTHTLRCACDSGGPDAARVIAQRHMTGSLAGGSAALRPVGIDARGGKSHRD